MPLADNEQWAAIVGQLRRSDYRPERQQRSVNWLKDGVFYTNQVLAAMAGPGKPGQTTGGISLYELYCGASDEFSISSICLTFMRRWRSVVHMTCVTYLTIAPTVCARVTWHPPHVAITMFFGLLPTMGQIRLCWNIRFIF